MGTIRTMEWHFTSEMLPEQSGLYIVTRSQSSTTTESMVFIKQLEDWDFQGEEQQYVDDDGDILEFPLWIEPRAWLDDCEIYPEDFHWYVEEEPYAWMELPTPCNDEEPQEKVIEELVDLDMGSLF